MWEAGGSVEGRGGGIIKRAKNKGGDRRRVGSGKGNRNNVEGKGKRSDKRRRKWGRGREGERD